MTKPSSSPKIERLRDRAHMLAQVRAFFSERHVIEVDCPILSLGAAVDVHIDLITACYAQKKTGYLHSSPEYGMKRLLAEGIGDIYQLSHVFRDNESSLKHNPEFMMIEWYRKGMIFPHLIDETLDLCRLFIGDLPKKTISYREAFQRYAGLDYLTATEKDLLHYLEKNKIESYPNIEKEGKDALLNLILAVVIEPQLGQGELCALAYYPASQAALALRCQRGDELAAERFEVYYQGLELANGYHELADPIEQRKRFIEANEQRIQLGKTSLPLDEEFLSALEKGLPDCCGVAVGFDRLMMLRHQTSNIADILPLGKSF